MVGLEDWKPDATKNDVADLVELLKHLERGKKVMGLKFVELYPQ